MKKFLLLMLVVCSFLAEAATYDLPSNRPAGCSRNGQVVTCNGNLNLGWNDVINVTGNVILNIGNNANFENAKINQNGLPSALTINIGGNLGSNSDFRAKANFNINGNANFGYANIINGNVSADDINTSSESIFVGNLTAESEIRTASANTITGTLQAEEIVTGSSNTINGNLIAEYVETGSANTIQGNISAEEINIRSSGTQVTGDLNADEDIFIGSQAVINGNVTSGDDINTNSPVTINGAVSAADQFTLASGSSVTGPVTATDVTMQPSNAQINGNITVSDTLTVGSGGVVIGSVVAENVVLENGNGRIEGDVDAEEDVEVGYGAQIIGNVTAENVANNGTIQGDVEAENTVDNGSSGQITGDVTAPHIDNDGNISGGTSCDSSSGGNAVECDAAGSTDNLWWRFNEASWNGIAGEVKDSGTLALHGRARNSATVFDASPAISGNPGTCGYGEFVGQASGSTSQNVEIPNTTVINNANTFSVSFWMNINAASQPASSFQTLLAYGDTTLNNTGRFELYRNTAGNLVFELRMQSNTVHNISTAGAAVFDGTWQYITATYNRDSRTMRLYVNGTQMAIRDSNNIGNATDAKTPRTVTGAMAIGAIPGGANGITGKIDEVRFHARELTPAEIAVLRNTTNACTNSSTVLSWDLNQGGWSGAANEVLDFSGNNLHGRTFNGVLASSVSPALSGDPGTCAFAQFNGSNRYIETADNNLLDISTNLTIGVWVRPTSRPSGSNLRAILSKDGNYEIMQRSDGRILWRWTESGGTNRTLLSDNAIANNSWTHVLIRYTSGSQRIYLNGVENSSSTRNANLQTNSSTLQLGQDHGAANSFFAGDLDELRIYARALTNSQIAAVMAERKACTQCFTENFYSTENWYASAYLGSETPTVETNPQRLRLTRNITNQATSMTLRKLFPGKGNQVKVEFNLYAWRPSSVEGADGIAVTLSDANSVPAPGSFGGSLGYAQRDNGDPGFAGGWLGIGIDAYGNFSASSEGRIGGFNGTNRRPQSVAIRGSSPNYRYLAGAALSPNVDNANTNTPGPGHRYRISVDARNNNEALVTVERDTTGSGNNYSTVISSFNAATALNQSTVPDNFYLSFTAATGGSVNYHELATIQVCTVQNAPDVVIGAPLHHYEISYGAQGLTCSPTEATIRACANADCSQLYASPVTLTLAATDGANWVGGGTVTFTGSTTRSLQKTGVGNTTLSVTNPSVAASNALQCRQNGVADDCVLNFADSGFVFDVADMVANESQNVVISAVRKDNASQQCVPGFADVTKAVKLWSDYIDPVATARPESRSVLINTQPIAQTEINAQVRNLAFNANGQATVALNYIDAGQMQLNASYEGTGAELGLLMTGSDQFVSRPAGLCVQEGNGSVAPVSCVSPYSNCGAYKKAGEVFPLSVIAKASDNLGNANLCANLHSTPNFRLNTIALTHSLVAPLTAEGASPGNLGVGSYNHIQSAGGVVTTSQTVSEVGVFSFTATPAANSYFGYTILPATSAPVGRFIPSYFTASVNTPVLEAACNAASLDPSLTKFAYLGQAVGYQVFPQATLTAKNVQGATTTNYGLSFFKAQSMTATTVGQMNDATAYSTLSTVATAEITGRGKIEPEGGDTFGGEFELAMSNLNVSTPENLRFARTLPYSAPVLSPALGLKLDLTDSFVRDSDGVCVKTADNGSCLPVTFSSITAPELRYGRLRLSGGSVPEAHPTNAVSIPVSLFAEYWNGTSFVSNTVDNCSAVNFNSMTVESGHGKSGIVDTLTAGKNDLNTLIVQVPASIEGSWPVFYTAPDWLKFDWLKEATGQPLVLENPTSEVSVGRFRGNKRQIFWQERLN